jgi:U3 small nucleolar RNA-associated protein 21
MQVEPAPAPPPEEAEPVSRIMKNNTFATVGSAVANRVAARSQLAELLQEGASFEQVTHYLQKLNPSAVDLAIRTLCSGDFDADGVDLLVLFAAYIAKACETNRDFEAVNAYLSRFLYIHGGVLRGGGGGGEDIEGDGGARRREQMVRMKEVVSGLVKAQERGAERLKDRFQYTSSLLRTFSKLV